MNSSEIRRRFLAFFEKRGHAVIPSVSLPTSDEKGITNPTLFNTAGMQPIIPYLLGEPYIIDGQETKRLVDVQKCLRTVDIDDVGDKTHATFFEMLGNWSLGGPPEGYFKKEAIEWSYELLTSTSEKTGDQGFGLDPKRLYVTVFAGDANAPCDDKAADIWRDIFSKNGIDCGSVEREGVSDASLLKSDENFVTSKNLSGGDIHSDRSGRIFFMPALMNWWEAGENGPCGPDTEMYYDINNTFGGKPITREQFIEADSKRQVVEIWNDVFMQYVKKDGKIVGNLPKPSVDTGAGLERLAMVMQGVDNIYDTDLLEGVIGITERLSGSIQSQRLIADHIRASVFLVTDGVLPSNTGRGYVLRRLIRRAVYNTDDRNIPSEIVAAIHSKLILTYGRAYPELQSSAEQINQILNIEIQKFNITLKDSLVKLNKVIEFNLKRKNPQISSSDAFDLFQSHGLPIDMIISVAVRQGLSVDLQGFETEFKKHQELSRSGSEQKFKGGLADANDPMVVKYHTATHLLHQALHDILGDGVEQKGSNITAERLRFDFSHGAKMTGEQKKRVEDIVNEKIAARLPINNVVMPRAEAEKTGARHFFGEKYGDRISIYFVGDDLQSAYSKEFCGGPHVKNTSELAGPEGKWKFKIIKEEAVAQGIRRIKAVLQ